MFNETIKNSVILYKNKSNVLINGKKDYISADHKIVPFEQEGHIYLPTAFFCESIGEVSDECKTYEKADVLCKKYNQYLHIEKNGLIAYGDPNLKYAMDWTTHLYELRDVIESFIYDDVTGEELYRLLLNKFPQITHPRLILTEDNFADIRHEVNLQNGDNVL